MVLGGLTCMAGGINFYSEIEISLFRIIDTANSSISRILNISE